MKLNHRGEYPDEWEDIASAVKREAGWKCVRCRHPHDPFRRRTLTVHHFDGDKGNCARWNLMALCQSCHLTVQGRVDPATPIMFTPSAWAMPYIAGVYASGKCVPPPRFSLSAWIETYEREIGKWPAWAATGPTGPATRE